MKKKTTTSQKAKKNKLELKAEKRNLFGRKVKKLRRQGIIPAVVYGRNFDSIAVQFPQSELKTIRQAGETSVIYLSFDSQNVPVMIKQIQFHPVTNQVLHVDFYKVNLKEKVSTEVPIELVGEAPISKQGYNIVQVLHEVEVVALPTDIPQKIEVDISSLEEENQDIRLKDIKLPSEKIKLAEDADLEETVVIVEKPKEEVEEEVKEEEKEEEEKKEEKEEIKPTESEETKKEESQNKK